MWTPQMRKKMKTLKAVKTQQVDRENTLLATVGEGMMLSTQARDQGALVALPMVPVRYLQLHQVFIENDVSNDDDIAVKVGADVLVMTRDHLIAAYADGNIRWINHTTAEFERELPVSSYMSVYNSLNNVGSETR